MGSFSKLCSTSEPIGSVGGSGFTSPEVLASKMEKLVQFQRKFWKFWSLMSPPLLGVEGEGRANVSLVAASASMDTISQNGLGLKERNYLGLSDCSSVDSSPVSSVSEDNKSNLNLKATELRLGLPGSQSRADSDLSQLSSGKFEEKPLFPLVLQKMESIHHHKRLLFQAAKEVSLIQWMGSQR
ncbi:Auxin-responsive protein IAA9 [Camellia lanceoleosa]|uniref:Auxin-responsive protein IAA9 n=1 Tax=Camellia lanceoleosa TaxID=1840588 RepID=A0ACC0IZ98_9ERIC|nr:Auxin-responsive protein IAA9 [Camellia lanceoleosa]